MTNDTNISFSKESELDLFSERSRWQSWLDVEAALALSQAEMGVIPEQAGPHIASQANLEAIGVESLRDRIGQTMAPVFALSECLAKVCGDDGDYVHWGATTQNIIETGRLIILQRVQKQILDHLNSTLQSLSALAREHAHTTMVGRTNRQNALPITFGFKIAGWIDELLRVRDQIKEVEPRLFQLRFGGALGGFHSLGADGFKLSEILAKKLNLELSLVPNRTSTDPLIEYITKLSMIGVACSRISDELYLLMTEEIGEVFEVVSDNVIGSSTMPHKVNPKFVIELVSLSAQLRTKGAAALAVSAPSHEGDAATNRLLTHLIEETCVLSINTLQKLNTIISIVKPNISKMRDNYQRSREMMATESLMMKFALSVGRGKAHDIIHALVEGANKSKFSLHTVIMKNDKIVNALGHETINKILCIDENTGQCAAITINICDIVDSTLLE